MFKTFILFLFINKSRLHLFHSSLLVKVGPIFTTFLFIEKIDLIYFRFYLLIKADIYLFNKLRKLELNIKS